MAKQPTTRLINMPQRIARLEGELLSMRTDLKKLYEERERTLLPIDRKIEGQLLIGLGNPFSWKKSCFAKSQVKDLDESLASYRNWLSTRIAGTIAGKTAEKLEAWEEDYLTKVNALSQAISANRVKGLVCWCIQCKNYVPVKGLADKKCHTQILLGCCLWLIERGLVKKDQPAVDLRTGKRINVFYLW